MMSAMRPPGFWRLPKVREYLGYMLTCCACTVGTGEFPRPGQASGG